MHPEHGLAAPSHPDPYPYYRHLVANMPMHRDDRLGMWVAASADAVQAVLLCPECRVRPLHEPVPAPLIGSTAGDVLRRLVRMNDGAFHQRVKPGLSMAVSLHMAATHWAELLERKLGASEAAAGLEAFAFQLPVHVLASALGTVPDALAEVTTHVAAFARCLSPNATAIQVERGNDAAAALLRSFEGASWSEGVESDVAAANTLGLLLQAYEATAGLILSTIAAFGRYPSARTAPLHLCVEEVARFDAPVQNTRRFTASSVVIGGQEVGPGEEVLVVLAAANRDGAVNPHPEASIQYGGPHAASRLAWELMTAWANT